MPFTEHARISAVAHCARSVGGSSPVCAKSIRGRGGGRASARAPDRGVPPAPPTTLRPSVVCTRLQMHYDRIIVVVCARALTFCALTSGRWFAYNVYVYVCVCARNGKVRRRSGSKVYIVYAVYSVGSVRTYKRNFLHLPPPCCHSS